MLNKHDVIDLKYKISKMFFDLMIKGRKRSVHYVKGVKDANDLVMKLLDKECVDEIES